MCFSGHLLMRAHTAKEDIVCYKILDYNNGRYLAPFFPIEYKFNKVNKKETLKKEWGIFTWIINCGYHSFIDKNHAIDFYASRIFGRIIMECVIPRGTKYYKNKNTYVSETIILKKIVYESNS